jgi:ribosomal peptide maturation radical SAM protein 1
MDTLSKAREEDLPPVLLINMPFANLRWPNLGPSLLKAALLREGIPCRVMNFNFDFAEQIGYDRYQWIADCFAFVHGGERLFAKFYFGDRLPDDGSYFEQLSERSDREFGDEERHELQQAEKAVPGFILKCFQAVDWSRVKVVGFSISFQQTMASMCLAKLIKHEFPHVVTVFGGAACEGEMGVALWEQFSEVDYVFLGEADLSFPVFIREVLRGSLPQIPPGVVGLPIVPGVSSPKVSKKGGPSASLSQLEPNSPPIVCDLDALPVPDFEDYFDRLGCSPLRDQIEPFLFFETSRGCWWGEKHHCKFCGLNGSRLAFRSKSPRRAFEELVYLTSRYGIPRICAADNIFDYRYFRSFLPLLVEAGIQVKFVYELKCNLTRDQIQQLVQAGLGAAQLGIETFVTRLLRLAHKGATGLQNLQTLKWFSEYPIEVEWNLLYGFPGEKREDYGWLANLIPGLFHLAPPLAIGRVRMDRFSPYFEEPEAHGLVNPRPHWSLRYVFPFPEEVLRRLAYSYEFDFADGRNPDIYARQAVQVARQWQELKGQTTFRAFDRPDGVLVLTDTRPGAREFQSRLKGWLRELYLFCDQGRTLRSICEFLAVRPGGPDYATLHQTLNQWLTDRWMVLVDEHYLSLATRTR